MPRNYELNHEFHFNMDVCAHPETALTPMYHSALDLKSALAKPWRGRCWMNPPYGRTIGRWVERAYQAAITGEAEYVVCLLPSRTDTAWWHDYCMRGEIRFLRGRLHFGRNGKKGGRAPFPSAVVIFEKTKGSKLS